MSSEKLFALADEYECMANAHRDMGEKEESESCELIVKAIRFYIVSLEHIPVAWRWITDPREIRWTFGAYAPSNATKKEPLFRGPVPTFDWNSAIEAAAAVAVRERHNAEMFDKIISLRFREVVEDMK